jgi:adenylate cyclase
VSWGCGACSAENVAGTRFCGYCGARRGEPAQASDQVLVDALESLPAGTASARAQAARASSVEERRVVTSLFADVSGFTTLAELLGPEELHEVIAPIITGMAEIAERYEGFIAKYAGDALLVFFGAPIAHEDDHARALLVAQEMHQRLPSFVAELPPGAMDVSLHVGVSTGRVVSGRYGGEQRSDYSILGDAVILAQRLESVAGPGDTFVSQSTYELTRDEFRFESLGEMQLKGKLRPVPVWRLLGRRSQVAISGTALDPPVLPLVGRDDELASAWVVLDRLALQVGGVVTVAGEAGVGKTRVVRELRDQARDAGVRWYQARCVSYSGALPYWPFADLLRQVAGIRPEDAPAVATGRLEQLIGPGDESLPYLASLLGLPVELPDDLSPQGVQDRARSALAHWVRTLTAEGPVALAVEDLHWADSASLQVLRDLARLGREVPLALVVTTRPEGAGNVRALAERASASAELTLGPLPPAALRKLIEQLLDGAPPPELEVLAERADGNPLFAQELVSALREAGVLHQRNGRWRVSPGWDISEVPASVEQVLASRIDGLPPEEAAVLQTAAVVGRVVPAVLMDRIATQAHLAHLESLVGRGLLHRTVFLGDPAVMFGHALVQEVAYGRLLRRHREQLHRQVAVAARELFGDGDDVIELHARHLYLGRAGAEAVVALRRAGERARRLYANDEALLHVGRAAEVAAELDDPPVPLGELELVLAELHEGRGDFVTAHDLYCKVRDRSGDVRAWRGVAASLRKQGAFDEAEAEVEAAFGVAELSGEDLAWLWLERAWIHGYEGRLSDAVTAATRGLEVTTQRRSEVVALLLVERMRARQDLGELEGAIADGEAAVQALSDRHEGTALATALRGLGGVLSQAGLLDRAGATLRRALALAERSGTVEQMAGCLVNLGMVELHSGRIDEAIACDQRAIEALERIDHVPGQVIAGGNLAYKLFRAGDLDGAERWCNRTIALAEATAHTWTVPDARMTLARVAAARGDAATATALAEDAARRFEEIGSHADAAEAREIIAELATVEADGGG